MRTPQAIAGSAVFFIAAPCVVAGLVPWLLTDRYRLPLSSVPGFVPAGCHPDRRGHRPARSFLCPLRARRPGHAGPVAPTERLVIGGIYRHVRNPMYVAVLSIILGQALLFSSWSVVAYAVIGAIVMGSFVRFYEEPTLARRYGAEYETYRRNVPGWLPRLTPWRG